MRFHCANYAGHLQLGVSRAAVNLLRSTVGNGDSQTGYLHAKKIDWEFCSGIQANVSQWVPEDAPICSLEWLNLYFKGHNAKKYLTFPCVQWSRYRESVTINIFHVTHRALMSCICVVKNSSNFRSVEIYSTIPPESDRFRGRLGKLY